MFLHHATYSPTRSHTITTQYSTKISPYSRRFKYLMRCYFSPTGYTISPESIWGKSHPDAPPNRIRPGELQTQLERTLIASIKPTTNQAYQHHWQSFHDFIRTHLHLQPTVPSDINHICLFIIHLANSNLSHATIRTYLTAISFAHKMANLVDPTTAFIINKTLQGIRNLHHQPTSQRLPITKTILHSLLQSLPYAVITRNEHILWHAFYLVTYHACLRAGEITLSKNPANVIQFSQVVV